MGLGPEAARPGDFIAVLPGGAVPYVLRKSREPELYEFIGERLRHSAGRYR
jgi:hypothetical protein